MKTKSHVVVDCFKFLLCLLLTNLAGASTYTLTLIAQGSGLVERNPTNAAYPAGVVVTITADPNAGWYFANWSGGTNSTANPLNVTMNADLVITGNFVAYPIWSVAVVTNGQGAIALNPPGGSYLSNTLVTATATPAAGWVFEGWSGPTNSRANPVSFAVNTNGTLTGTFAELPAFDVQPMSVTNKAGSTVSFSAHAVGTAPVGYTWNFSGGSLTTVGTNSTLSLTNVGSGQAGSYWVVATNNYGSATSQVASLILTNAVGPTNLVNSLNEEGLLAAIALGGWVGMQFNGTITLTNTVTITNNVVLDGTRFGATISGGNAVRLFYVATGASLTVSNLTLANGNCVVTNGPPGTPADGGAICSDGGTVTLAGCTLTNNAAHSLVSGGLARGGALFNNGGSMWLYQSVMISNFVVGGIYTGVYTGSGLPGSEITSDAAGFGGALYSTNGVTTIIDSAVLDNSSQDVCDISGIGVSMGGAIFQASGTLNITNSSFSMNQAVGGRGSYTLDAYFIGSPAYGGAVAVTGGSLAIELSQFENNQAAGAQGVSGDEGGGGGAASGGAVYCTGACSASDSTFSGNGAVAGNCPTSSSSLPGCGGGIYNDGTMTLNRCSVYGNNAQGGALDRDLALFSTIAGGSGLGGGVCNEAQLAATNCTIALNSAVGALAYNEQYYGSGNTDTATGPALGGGVYNDLNATSVFMNLTIGGNSCNSPWSAAGPPGYNLLISSNGLAAGSQIANTNGTLSIHNTIVAYGTNSNAYGPITDDGYNICSDGSAALFSGSSYNYTDPKLAPLGNYGGPTLCMALLPDSPAIDTGDTNGCPTTDQRGYIRPFGAGPDIGAYEYGSAASDTTHLNLSVTTSNVTLSFSVFLTNTYYLQSSTNLVNWVNVSTNGPFAGETYVIQTFSQQGLNRCFFRLLLK